MKACSLNEFMEELNPWLDKDHIRSAEVDDKGHMIIHFMDGMKTVYTINDCNKQQVDVVLQDLKKKGIAVV